MPELGNKGAELDLIIRQGATCGPNNTVLKDGAGSPIDITSAVLRAQIRKTADAATIAASADFTIVSAVDGSFNWEFSATDTAALDADPVDENQPDSTYVWDMEIEFVDGRVVPLLYGAAKVFREVTK